MTFQYISTAFDILKVLIRELVPGLRNYLFVKASAAPELFHHLIHMPHRMLDVLVRCILRTAQDDSSCICKLRGEQVVALLGQIILQLGIHDHDHISYLIPTVKRFLVQHIEKFVHIKDSRRLDHNSVDPSHPKCNQLCFQPPDVRLVTISTGNHLHITERTE